MTSCHDEVDLSLCFEDTAVLYAICAIFWFLAGVSFLQYNSNGVRPRLTFGVLYAAKLVITAVLYICNVSILHIQNGGSQTSVAEMFVVVTSLASSI